MKIEKINELFARFAGQLLKMRWIALGIFSLVIIVSLIGMKRMVKETSFDDYFIEDDPMLVMTDEFKSHFGNDYYVGVLTQCDNHFTQENLTTLRALPKRLGPIMLMDSGHSRLSGLFYLLLLLPLQWVLLESASLLQK